MSEQIGKGFCNRIATPKNREICRNAALVAWISGVGPSILAVVILNGTTFVFAALVTINVAYLILNCSFCFISIQTLKKKRTFYIACLIFMITNDAVLVIDLARMPEDIFKIIGYVGFALIFISCLSLAVLNTLLIVHGPFDPVPGDIRFAPGLNGDAPDGFVEVRYVSFRRGRQNGSIFQVEAGQVLNIPHPGDTARNTEQSQPPDATNRQRSRFGFRSRAQRQTTEGQMPIRIISNGIFGSQRRGSAISLLRRPSTESIEYDTGSIRCTCFCSSSDGTENEDDLPSYSESPTGNISACPIHGINSITPPAYERTSAYNTLCSVLGLPKYEDVVVSKSDELPSVFKLVAEQSNGDTSLPVNTTRTNLTDGAAAVLERFITPHMYFETIVEDGSETSASTLPENISQEPSTSSNLTDIPLATPSSSTTTPDAPPAKATTTDVPSAMMTTASVNHTTVISTSHDQRTEDTT